MRFIFCIFILSPVLVISEELFVPTTEGDPSSLIEGRIHAVTGRLAIVEDDLVIQGVEPIRISRTYLDKGTGEWRFCVDFAQIHDTDKDYRWQILEKDRCPMIYKRVDTVEIQGKKWSRCELSSQQYGFSNTARGEISSRTNVQNSRIFIDEKFKNMIVHAPDGTVRTYKKIRSRDREYQLLSEHLSNGNWILYEYKEIKIHDDEIRVILSSIRTTNPAQDKVFARAEFLYEDPKGKNKHFYIAGSDGQVVEYHFERNTQGRLIGNLYQALSSAAPDRTFRYLDYHNSYAEYKKGYKGIEQKRLNEIWLPDNRKCTWTFYKREYEEVNGERIHMGRDDWREGIMYNDPRRDRVKTVSMTRGTNPTPQLAYSFVYEISPMFREVLKSSVYDAEGGRVDYHSDRLNKIVKIERFAKDGSCVGGEQFIWSSDVVSRLEIKVDLDRDLKPVTVTRYTYDARGNVIEKKISGNFSGKGAAIRVNEYGRPLDTKCESYSRKFRYSVSEPNLLLEEFHDTGLHIVYDYLDGTDLLISQLTYDGEQLMARHFWEYNKDHVLICEIEDDGSSDRKDNLTGVQVRKIRSIQPLTTGAYLGMPHVVEEKFWDGHQEKLLKKMVFTYATGGKIAKKEIFDANGQHRFSLCFEYDEKGRLIERTNPLGQTEIMRYDACGNRTYARDFSGRIEMMSTYDFTNSLIKEVAQGDGVHSRSFQYDRVGNMVSEVDVRGHETLHSYDAKGRCIRTAFMADGMMGTVERELDHANRPVSSIDAEGNTTLTCYNAYGKPISIVYADRSVETYQYYLNGDLKIHIRPGEVSTEYEYDGLGRTLKKTIRGRGVPLAKELFVYQGALLMSHTNLEGHTTIYKYDGAGRKIQEELDGEVIRFYYDELGRMYREERGDVAYVKKFDLMDRTVQECTELVQGEVLRKTAYDYDSAGNVKSVIRSVGGMQSVEQRCYDSWKRLISQTDPLGYQQTTQYFDFFQNDLGQKVLQTVLTDPMGLKRIDTFDPKGRVAKIEMVKNGVLSTEERRYNRNDKIILKTCAIPAKKMTVEWVYDSMGRILRLIEDQDKVTTYDYTLSGKISSVVKPNGVTLYYWYDSLDFPIRVSSSDSTVDHTMWYDLMGRMVRADGLLRTFDAKGRVTMEMFPHSLTVYNKYDANGRRVEFSIPRADCVLHYQWKGLDLSSVSRKTMSGNELYTHKYLVYDLSGNVLEEASAMNCGRIEYNIDLLSRKTSIESPTFSQKIAEYDPAGNICSMERQDESFTYTYDSLYQLTAEPKFQYRYDALHNRKAKNNEEYQVNNQNQLVSHFTYDCNGNPVDDGKMSYKFDALDRLISISTPEVTQIFVYDVLNRCVKKITTRNADEHVQYFLYDGQNEIASFDRTFNCRQLRVLGATPHAEIGSAVAVELKDKLYVPIHDLQGNVAQLISMNDEPITSYRYSAFGEEEVVGPAKNPWRFSSKRVDDETGLVYFGRRFYSPSLGRWLSPDPSGFDDGMNLYQYVHNAPLTHCDDYGLISYHYRNGWQSEPYWSPYSIEYGITHKTPAHLDPSVHLSLDPLGMKGYSPLYYVNGIYNTPADSRSGARALLKTFEGKAHVMSMYSESFGRRKDLISVWNSIHDENYSSFAVRRLNREIEFQAACLDALQDPRKIFISAFSRGAADTYHATKNLGPRAKDRLMITANGPIMVLPNSLGHSVINLVSKGDWCSWVCNGGFDRYMEDGGREATVHILPRDTGLFGLRPSHYFESETYQDGICEFVVPEYQKYGGLN